MLGLFQKSPQKTLRKDCRRQLELARKVINYRKDCLSTEAIAEIEARANDLRQLVESKDDWDTDRVRAAKQALHVVMLRDGGDIYPVHTWNDNIEVLLVVGIVAIAIRTFFFQPFKIPTNSMWPTYAGMKERVYSVALDESRPALPFRVVNKVTQFASNYRITSEIGGEVMIPVAIYRIGNQWDVQVIGGEGPHKFSFGNLNLLPQRRYQLHEVTASGKTYIHDLDVPRDFTLEDVVRKSYFPEAPSLISVARDLQAAGQLRVEATNPRRDAYRVLLPTGYAATQGEPLIDFDIHTGDMLFVDRFSYHFFAPDIGDPIVFRVENIPGLRVGDEGTEQYYIKRLVGKGGDELEIRDGALFRNGQPITGSIAFDKNAQRDGEYDGYVAAGFLESGETDTIVEGYYYAMGDNSDDSKDSRLWSRDGGFYAEKRTSQERFDNVPPNQVPRKDVVGKALFIFYPLSTRWGPAK